MKRIYRNKPTIDVDYFVGNEVEKTPFYGRKTLFVVGFKNPRKIVKKATDHHCRHIYLGANMSFKNVEWNDNRTAKLRDIITHLLDNQFQVTLDISKTFDLTTIDMFIDSDDEVCRVKQKIDYLETCINSIDRILKEIHNRGFAIKNTIEIVKYYGIR